MDRLPLELSKYLVLCEIGQIPDSKKSDPKSFVEETNKIMTKYGFATYPF